LRALVGEAAIRSPHGAAEHQHQHRLRQQRQRGVAQLLEDEIDERRAAKHRARRLRLLPQRQVQHTCAGEARRARVSATAWLRSAAGRADDAAASEAARRASVW
jgi:hypothetical protein